MKKCVPLKFVDGLLVECVSDEATHLRIHMPGPAGCMTLPVQIRGDREGTGNWTWNGDVEAPTLKPSVLVKSGHFADGFKEGKCWCTYNSEHPGDVRFTCYRCHTHVNDGAATFLEDTSHELRGQVVELIGM